MIYINKFMGLCCLWFDYSGDDCEVFRQIPPFLNRLLRKISTMYFLRIKVRRAWPKERTLGSLEFHLP